MTKNAGHENDGPSKLQDMKLQDMKLTDQFSRNFQGMKLQDMKMQDMKLQDKISRRNARGRTAQVRRRLVAQADTPHSSCLQLLPLSPLTWKSSQSLQQVMPWLVAGRLCHLRRW